MTTQRYETIIATRYEGMGVARNALRDLQAYGTGLEHLQRIAERTIASPFASLDASGKLSLARVQIRDYDALLQKIAQVKVAELGRSQAVRTINSAPGPVSLDTAIGLEKLDLRSRVAVGAANKRLEDALNKQVAAVEAEAEASRRRAVFGEHHEKLINKAGYLNYPPSSDPQFAALRGAVTSGRKESSTRAAIERQRMETEDLARASDLGKQNLIERHRMEQEDLARSAELGKQNLIERQRMERENLDRRDEVGKQSAIERHRMEQEDLARSAEIGKQITTQRQRMEREDLARREVLGQQSLIEQQRVEREALALRAETGKQSAITQKRIESADVAAHKQAALDAEGVRQQGVYSQFQSTYSNTPNTPVGRAQGDVNKAERALESATIARADLLRKGNPTATQMHAAERAYESATSRLAAARSRLAIVEARGTSVRSQFMAGFRGASERPYAEQIGQAFKFSVFYGTAYRMLFALTTTLAATLQEGIEFQNAMTELKIASGRSAEAASEMAEGLGAQATAAGLAPSQGVSIGARSLGLFNVTEASGASQAEQDRVSLISARVVSRMALGSKTSPEDLQTQLAAVANAFGGGAAGQIRAYDLDAYMGRIFGIEQGKTIQAVAESGNVGQAAGFDQEQVTAISAALQAGTGQTPGTAAGWMAQIFSRGGEGSLTQLTQRYGIDTSTDLATQIGELAKVYQNASAPEKAEIAAGFGRGKVQDAGIILLERLPAILGVAETSRTESRGEGDRISNERLGNIGGQIALTVAAMQAFASELSASGVLDLLGAGIVALRELVEAATGLLNSWNTIPPAIKSVVASLALLAIAGRMGAGAGALSMLGLGARTGLVGVGPGTAGGVGVGAAGGVGAKNALASAGPWIAAAAGLYAIGELVNSTNEFNAAEKKATSLLNTLGEDNSPDGLRARAAELTQSATVSREAADGSWMNNVIPVLRGRADDARALASESDMEALRLEAAAKVIENAALANTGRQALITGFDEKSLTESMDAITRSGGSATDRMRALDEALQGTANAAAAFTPELFAAQQGEALVGLLGDNITGITGKDMTPKAVRDALSGYGGTPESALELALRGAGVGDAGDLDLDSANRAAQDLVAKTEGTAGYVGTEEYDAAVKIVRDWLMTQTRDARIMVDSAISLTPEEGMLNLAKTLEASGDKRANLQETDYRGKTGNSRRLVRKMQRNIDRTQGGGGDEMQVQLDLARRQLAEDQFNELENMRRAAQRSAKSKAEIAKIGHRFLRRELRAAIKGGNQDVLAEIIGQAGDGAVRIARAIIREAINAANAARAAYLKILAVQREASSIFDGMEEFVRGGLSTMPDAATVDPAITKMQGALGNMQTAAPGENVYELGSDLPGYEPPKAPKAGKSPEDKKAEREAARQEMLDLKNNLYLLSIDLTDPLARAVAAVKDARRRLASDIGSGQDKGTIAASRVALRESQAEKEATAFQQRLDAVTTAEELGRISHRKYISYLQNERRRLNGIKDRTFQQQQQLDSIDRLMMSAADSMQGMWNFGDIKLPTPLQIRRQVEGLQEVQRQFDPGAVPGRMGDKTRKQIERDRSDRSTQLDATSRQVANTSTIYIDGADTGKVRQIIHEVLDKSNGTVTNRPRRR